MVIVKATQHSETGALPSQQLLSDMGKYNEELVKAGLMLAGEGLHPSSRGAKVHFDGDQRTVENGPFDLDNLICGFWIWRVKSMQEAIDWAKKAPNPHPGAKTHLEIRRIFEAEEFGENFTPELREQEDRLRAETEKLAAAH
jgi:hypothetical protein